MSINRNSTSLRQVLRIVFYRKYLILACLAFTVSLVLLITFLSPKKYISSAKLLINNNNSTNLADFNPFVLSRSEQNFSPLYNQNKSLSDEIEIISSNIVLGPVIVEQNLKYKSGKNKGKYFLSKDIIPNFNIKNIKGSNIIEISYKSLDPEFSYKMVDSIIRKYKEVTESINVQKASKDKQFLEKEYLNAQKSVNEKISRIKSLNDQIGSSGENMAKSHIFDIILSKYDKRINSEFKASSRINAESKKLNIELEQDVEKLKMLKTKYNWISIVENLSKTTTKVIVIEKPILKKYDEFFEPRIFASFLFSVILGIAVSFLAVLAREKIDKRVNFSSVNTDFILINENYADFTDIVLDINSCSIDKAGIISLLSAENEQNFVDHIKKILTDEKVKSGFTNNDNLLYEHIENIISSNYVVILSEIGFSDKEAYEKIIQVCNKLDKKFLEYSYLV